MGQKFSSLVRRPPLINATVSKTQQNPTPSKPCNIQDPQAEAFFYKENELAWQATKMYQLSHIDIHAKSIRTGQLNADGKVSTSNNLSNAGISMDVISKVLLGEAPDKVLKDSGVSDTNINAFHQFYSVAIRPLTESATQSDFK